MKSPEPPASAIHVVARPFSPDDPLLPPEAAAAYFGGAPSARTLERYRALGIGPRYLKLSGRILYRRSALDAYLDLLEQGSPRKRGAG